MNLREAAQQALEALLDDCLVQVGPHSWERRSDLAIAALRAALAEPVQEPVAWLSIDCIGERYLCFSKPLDNDPVQPLYTHPPQRKPLTEEHLTALCRQHWDRQANILDHIAYARAIEQAHGIEAKE